MCSKVNQTYYGVVVWKVADLQARGASQSDQEVELLFGSDSVHGMVYETGI